MAHQLPPIEASTTHHPGGGRVTTATERAYGYVWVSRAKRSQPWTLIAHCWVAGDVCAARAADHFKAHGYSEVHGLSKLMDDHHYRALVRKVGEILP